MTDRQDPPVPEHGLILTNFSTVRDVTHSPRPSTLA